MKSVKRGCGAIAAVVLAVSGAGVQGGLTTCYEYNSAGDVTASYSYEVSGVTLSYEGTIYDDLGRRVASTKRVEPGNANGVTQATLYVYDVAGRLATQAVKVVDDTLQIASGDLQTVYQYDVLGRQTRVLGPSTALSGTLSNSTPVTAYEYDLGSNVTRQRVLQSVNGSEVWADTWTDYDALNRATKVTDPEGHYRRTDYDSRGQAIREYAYSQPGNVTLSQSRTVYDNAGRVVTRARMLQAATASTVPPVVTTDNVVCYQYDDGGRLLTQTTFNMGQSTPILRTYQYDSLGRMTLSTDAAAVSDWTVYNEYGQVTQRTTDISATSTGRAQTMTYDSLGRMTQSVAAGTPDLTTTYGYDALGRRTQVIDPSDQITSYFYDGLGRQLTMREADGGITRDTYSLYAKSGQLTRLIADNGTEQQTTEYSYGPLGLVNLITYPMGGGDTLAYNYYASGKVSSYQDQAGGVLQYSYDLRGLLTQVSQGASYQKSYGYDGLARMVLAQKGTSGAPAAESETTYYYDDLSRVTTEGQKILDQTVKYLYSSYDQAGNRLTLIYPQ